MAPDASGEEDQRYANRDIRQLLTHLPSRRTCEQVLAAARGTA